MNSFHHQSVDEPGQGVVVTGRAPDGVFEAFEVDGRPIIGAQWHPECFATDPVFDWLVATSLASRRSANPTIVDSNEIQDRDGGPVLAAVGHDPKERCS